MPVLENEYLIGALMQSERSDEEAVSRRGAASCIAVQGLAVCQHRGELFTVPTLLLFYLLSNVPLFLFSPSFLGPSSFFALMLSVFTPLCC